MINENSELYFQEQNKNKDFTLIARDCVGGVLYHQLGLKFLSPTINLFLVPEDFNYFCLNLREYISTEVVELKDDSVEYPVGVIHPQDLKPIKIHFMHYSSFEEAANKWNERKARINWNNLFVISSMCYPKELADLNDKLIKDWNKIPYKKVMLVDRKHGFDDEYVIEKPKDCDEYAWLLFKPDKKNEWKRTFNEFDFISFLKKEGK